RAIRDGSATGATLPIIYELPPDIAENDGWRNPEHWHLVTPNAGRSITIPRLIEDFERAELAGEGEVRRWASQHLNLEIGMSLRSDRWSGADYWQACGDKTLTLDSLIARSELVVTHIDGGGMDDLLGFAVLGREANTRQWLLWCHAWCDPIVLERRKGEASRLRDFQRAGELTIVSAAERFRQVADLVKRIEKSGKLPGENGVGVDTAGIGQIPDELALRGIK